MRRTKIVCTIGPSTDTPEAIRQLILAGMDVARLNFSHGTHETHRASFRTIRSVAAELDRNVAVMMDLQGPKIRTGLLEGGGAVELIEGAPICVTTREVPGDASCVSTTYLNLPRDVSEGDRLLIADGAMELGVERVSGPDVHCRVIRGGSLGQHKGINLPGVDVSAPCLTEKDLEDLEFGIGLGPDYVALSFVRTAEDIRDLKQRIDGLAAEGADKPLVVAKIERPEALDNFDAILEVTDAVMVARGDLGVEVDLDDVPQIQKRLIRECNERGMPVITATQMLESMMSNSRPTRAEVTDVANAIYDGTDAVMLSGETAAGRFPLEAVRVMADVRDKADEAIAASPERRAHPPRLSAGEGAHSDAIGQAVWRMTQILDVKRIVCFTMSGYTAKAIAKYRPHTPITAITLSEATLRRCALIWGVDALIAVEVTHLDEMVRVVDKLMFEHGQAKEGDTIFIVAGTPLAVGGRTNLLKLHTVGQEE